MLKKMWLGELFSGTGSSLIKLVSANAVNFLSFPEVELSPWVHFTHVCIYLCHRGTTRNTHTHTPVLMALFPGLPRWADTRKVKPIWILLKQETVSGSGISWAICKSASCSRQITTPAPHRSVFYRPDALPAAQPTASKHWRQSRYP